MQSNVFTPVKNVIRGIHFSDAMYEQTKVITFVSDSIQDYAIDLRAKTRTFGMHVLVELSEKW
jgi:dTDP-4-dehydrorhamnose 3,5-epimerase